MKWLALLLNCGFMHAAGVSLSALTPHWSHAAGVSLSAHTPHWSHNAASVHPVGSRGSTLILSSSPWRCDASSFVGVSDASYEFPRYPSFSFSFGDSVSDPNDDPLTLAVDVVVAGETVQTFTPEKQALVRTGFSDLLVIPEDSVILVSMVDVPIVSAFVRMLVDGTNLGMVWELNFERGWGGTEGDALRTVVDVFDSGALVNFLEARGLHLDMTLKNVQVVEESGGGSTDDTPSTDDAPSTDDESSGNQGGSKPSHATIIVGVTAGFLGGAALVVTVIRALRPPAFRQFFTRVLPSPVALSV